MKTCEFVNPDDPNKKCGFIEAMLMWYCDEEHSETISEIKQGYCPKNESSGCIRLTKKGEQSGIIITKIGAQSDEEIKLAFPNRL